MTTAAKENCPNCGKPKYHLSKICRECWATRNGPRRLSPESLRDIISRALSELGVPTPDYPAPVANAVAILQTAWPDAQP